jgi:hypothetical protein
MWVWLGYLTCDVLVMSTLRHNIFISGNIAVQSLFIGRLLNIKEKHNLSIYVRLHIFSLALTSGYTGKAKSCIGAWVPAVSIHRPLCLKKKLY